MGLSFAELISNVVQPYQGKRKQRFFWRANMECEYCGKRMFRGGTAEAIQSPHRMATVDHYMPLSKGGTWARSNLRACCQGCNRDKGSMDPEAWEAKLAAMRAKKANQKGEHHAP